MLFCTAREMIKNIKFYEIQYINEEYPALGFAKMNK